MRAHQLEFDKHWTFNAQASYDCTHCYAMKDIGETQNLLASRIRLPQCDCWKPQLTTYAVGCVNGTACRLYQPISSPRLADTRKTEQGQATFRPPRTWNPSPRTSKLRLHTMGKRLGEVVQDYRDWSAPIRGADVNGLACQCWTVE